MLRRPIMLLLLLALPALGQVAPIPPTQPAATAPTPALDEAHRRMDAGQYREALQDLVHILDLKGPAAAAYDRLEVLQLRAECHIQLRQNKPALDALDLAVRQAASAGKGDALCAALALRLLVQRSPGLTYTPRLAAVKGPIDIIDPTTRVNAYKALLADELPTARPKILAGSTAAAFPPVLEAARLTATLGGVEKAATGASDTTDTLALPLADHAALLLDRAVGDLAAQVERIAAQANEVVRATIVQNDPKTGRQMLTLGDRRRGLGPADVQTLQALLKACAQVSTTAGDLALELPTKAGAFRQTSAQGRDLQQRIAALLNDRSNQLPK